MRFACKLYYLRRKVRDVYDLRHIPKKRGRRPEAAAPFSYKSTFIHIHPLLFDVNNSLHANIIAVLQHCPYIYKGKCMEMYHFWIYYWTHRPTSLLLRRFLYMFVNTVSWRGVFMKQPSYYNMHTPKTKWDARAKIKPYARGRPNHILKLSWYWNLLERSGDGGES